MKLSAKVLLLALMLLSLCATGPLEKVASQGGTALASAKLSVSLTLPTKNSTFDYTVNNDPNLQPCIDEPPPFANGDCRITAPPNYVIFDDGGDGKPNGFGVVFAVGFPGAALAHADVPASTSTFLDSTRKLTYASNEVAAAATSGPPNNVGQVAVARSCGDSKSVDLVNLSGLPFRKNINGSYLFSLVAAASAGTAAASASFRVIDETTQSQLFVRRHRVSWPGGGGALTSCDVMGNVPDPDPQPGCAVPFAFGIDMLANSVRRIRIQACLDSIAEQETEDEIKPSCKLTSKSATGIGVTVEDRESGLAVINVLVSDNATCTIPSFTPGTTAPVVVTCTKNNLSKSAVVELQIIDSAGNVTTCDPVITLLEIAKGDVQTTQKFQAIPDHEHYVTIQNGAPGVRRLRIQVNRRDYVMPRRLKDDEVMTVDVSSLMVEGDNTITLTGYGDPGASALIIISDSGEGHEHGRANKRTPSKQPLLLPRFFQRDREMRAGINMVWGNQVEQ